MPSTKRLFYAIEIGEKPQELARRAQEGLRDAYENGQLRFTRPVDFHVTLLFLGERPETDVDTLIGIGTEIAPRHDSFSLKLTDIGAFPGLKTPRVLWLGIEEDDSNALSKLSNELRQRAGCEVTGEFLFKPHLTLARVASRLSLDQANSASKAISCQDWTFVGADRAVSVSRFVLMETLPVAEHTNSAESRYNIVHSFLLRKPRANHTPAANPLMEKVGN